MNDLTQVVVNALVNNSKPLTLLEIAQTSSFKMPRIVNGLDLLVDQGRVEVLDGVPVRYRLKGRQ